MVPKLPREEMGPVFKTTHTQTEFLSVAARIHARYGTVEHSYQQLNEEMLLL